MFYNRSQWTRLILCLILLILGFLLMSGPNTQAQDQFSEDLFSFRRITLAPFLILSAYGGLIYVIMKKQKTACPDKKQVHTTMKN